MRGVASTELAFVSNRSGNAEIYVMGADGSNPRAATANGSINAFPSWSPEGDAIVYTSYRYKDRPLLYLSSRGRGRPGRLLGKLKGDFAEYRGVYAPVVFSAKVGDDWTQPEAWTLSNVFTYHDAVAECGEPNLAGIPF